MDDFKYLYLMRHAKSDWGDPTVSDHDRILNTRGLRNAPYMGRQLRNKKPMPEQVVSSDAARALLTARMIAEEVGLSGNDVIVEPGIYEASRLQLQAVVQEQDDFYNSILLVGHNPGITELVNYWCDENFANIPTSGVVMIEFQTKHWSKTDKIKGKVLDFDYPKRSHDS